MNSSEKSILIVSELFEAGGVETYIAGQVTSFINLGWKVHLVCGNSYDKDFLPQQLTSFHPGYNFSPDSSFSELIETIKSLSEIIESLNITCVHAHPFTSLFPAFIAAKIKSVRFILTLHGPASLTLSYGNTYEYLLKGIVLPNSDLVITVSEETYMLAAPFCDESRLIIQQNAINLQIFQYKNTRLSDNTWLVVSRLDAVKINGIFEFIRLINQIHTGFISIAGDGPAKNELHDKLQEYGLLQHVKFLGLRNDIPKLMTEFDGVAGMGRVFLEAVACNRKVCLIGYDGVKGVLTEQLFEKAASCNFSGRNLDNVTTDEFKEQYVHLQDLDFKKINRILEERFNERKVWSERAQQLLNLQPKQFKFSNELFNLIKRNYEGNTDKYLYSLKFLNDIGKLLHTPKYYIPQLIETYHLYFDLYNNEIAHQNFTNTIESLTKTINSNNLIFSETTVELKNQISEKEVLISKISDLNTKLIEFSKDNLSIRADLKRLIEERELLQEQNIHLNNEKVQLTENLNTLNQNIQSKLLELESATQIKNELVKEFKITSEYWKNEAQDFKDQLSKKELICNDLTQVIDKSEKDIINLTEQNKNLLQKSTVLDTELAKIQRQYLTVESDLAKFLKDNESLSQENSILKKDLSELNEKNINLTHEMNNIIDMKETVIQEISVYLSKLFNNYVVTKKQIESHDLPMSEKFKLIEQHVNQLQTQLQLIKGSKFFNVIRLLNKEIHS